MLKVPLTGLPDSLTENCLVTVQRFDLIVAVIRREVVLRTGKDASSHKKPFLIICSWSSEPRKSAPDDCCCAFSCGF